MVVTLQADFTEAPEDIPALVKRIEGGADVVEAVDRTEGAEVPRALRWSRRGVPWLLRRRPLPEGVRGPRSRASAPIRVQVLKRALGDARRPPLLSREGWAANVELLLAVAPFSRRTDGTHRRGVATICASASRASAPGRRCSSCGSWRAARDARRPRSRGPGAPS